ncbi:antiviral reverse transcriptase Drt3b [Salinicola aestuarinus]|uniref:antiviral reverse transcriptase Drt3b n=1 Tax=Salinicola aestuarinus TaxID=1949082 RepID=UPI000DA24B9C|nr:antiviral reverse transcriptase Drt3b [Salinicola aestuarinus]
MSYRVVQVDKTDRARVLLTEVLPYEMPIFFTNYNLYGFKKRLDAACVFPAFIHTMLKAAGSYTIPFTYTISRGGGKLRTISLMHPFSQLEFADFYSKWDHYILNQCSKSEFSLRRPFQVGSVFFEPSLQDHNPIEGDVAGDIAPGSTADQRSSASSYFYYIRYNQIWRFFDSTEFRRVEQSFRKMLKLDISKCFHNIYTHSISWAVKNKSVAKKYRDAKTFDNDFDKLMQRVNWSETNGILVGPEVSRLFAEIILQDVDQKIKEDLSRKAMWPDKISIYRYVDDYMIFYNHDDHAIEAKKAVEQSLDFYKLFLNESKTEYFSSPLISGLAMARDSLRELFRERIDAVAKWDAPTEDHVVRPVVNHRSPDYLIKAIKKIVKLHDVGYSDISSYSLSVISRMLYKGVLVLKGEDVVLENPSRVLAVMNYLLEVVFFIYRMDIRVNTTYRLVSILIKVNEVASYFGGLSGILKNEVLDHGMSVLKQARQVEIGSCEISTLIPCLYYISGPRAISPDDLVYFLGLEDESVEANYFCIVAALFCAEQKHGYDRVRRVAVERALQIIDSADKDVCSDTQAFVLAMDLISCPYVSDEVKSAVLDRLSVSVQLKPLKVNDRNQVKKFIADNLAFCDWGGNEYLPVMLKRKEGMPAYD